MVDPPELARCFSCGAALPAECSFCSSCGVRLDSGIASTPPAPAAGEPLAMYVSEPPRLFGVPPQDTVLTIGAVAFALAIPLLVLGDVVVGVGLLGVGGFLLLVYVDAIRRRPNSAIAHRSVSVLKGLRAQLAFVAKVLAVSVEARIGRLRLRRQAAELAAAREGRLRALGEAAYGEDVRRAAAIRQALQELDAQIERAQTEAARTARRARLRVQIARQQRDRRRSPSSGRTGKSSAPA